MHHSDDNAVTTEESVWDLTMNINAKGVFLAVNTACQLFGRAGGGSIINTASFVAFDGRGHASRWPTPPAKAAVLALTRELAIIHARGKHPSQRALPWAAAHRPADELPQHR